MIEFNLPYNKTTITINLSKEKLAGILVSKAETYKPSLSQEGLVRNALDNPIGSKPLHELAIDKNHIVIISSDHTRPVPSHITMPILLDVIRKTNKNVKITIIIATGMHRPTTHAELITKYGKAIVDNEHIIVHNALNDEDMVFKGMLPSGGEFWVNKIVDEADLLIAEGFIEPHFFAGFSGGRKSVLPGIASKKTVLWNHNSKFISNPNAKAGNLINNPIHQDMLYAAQTVNLAFILNVVINGEKHIIHSFSGDVASAHSEGCKFVLSLAEVERKRADIVITTNGGYPLDQNIYQTVKGISTAEGCINDGGIIIIASSCVDGHGGDFFYHLLADSPSPQEAFKKVKNVNPNDTKFDQWQAQILSRILTKCHVILVTKDCNPQLIKDMHMIHAYTIEEALEKAYFIVGKNKKITLIPDGINVIIKDNLHK